jgi:hydroxymethylbilane synthase
MNISAPTIRIGTRSSKLALWQAEWVAGQLRAAGFESQLVLLRTLGDVTSGPIETVGGQGVFTKEIQRAVLDHQADVAVHSLKDLPTEAVSGLCLAAVPPREANQDVLLARAAASLDELPQQARVGTGSARRKAQLLAYRPDLHVADLRGNVETRLRKLDDGEYDAIVLAEAGLRRLGLAARITQRLPPEMLLPAVGQGALGLETRDGDQATQQAVAALDDRITHQAVVAERTLLAALRGGCLAPVGAWARLASEPDGWADESLTAAGANRPAELRLDALVAKADGSRILRATAVRPLSAATELGSLVARQLIAQGADELLRR